MPHKKLEILRKLILAKNLLNSADGEAELIARVVQFGLIPTVTEEEVRAVLAMKVYDLFRFEKKVANAYEYCPHCNGSFSFRKPKEGKCPWCKRLLEVKK